MKKRYLLIVAVAISTCVNAETVCIDKEFLHHVPTDTVRLFDYVKKNSNELIYLLAKKDATAYKTGLEILLVYAKKGGLPSTLIEQHTLVTIADYVASDANKFELKLKKLKQDDAVLLFNLYDLPYFQGSRSDSYYQVRSQYIKE